jgi:secreted trypsin-like serine protease
VHERERRTWILSPPLGVALPDSAVVHVISDGVGCSGTLVTPSLVLTAHHCVTERDSDGEILPRDVAPELVEVELGGDYLPWGKVGVRAIMSPPCGYRSGHGDIAILVLSRALVGIPTMEAVLEGPPRLGTTVDPIGFGRCPLTTDAVHRVRREGGHVEKVGTGSFFAAASLCPGDSGGPARDRATGQVVGVISAGAMDESDETRDPAFFTRLDVWKPLFEAAQLIVDGASHAEVPPIEGCDVEE